MKHCNVRSKSVLLKASKTLTQEMSFQFYKLHMGPLSEGS